MLEGGLSPVVGLPGASLTSSSASACGLGDRVTLTQPSQSWLAAPLQGGLAAPPCRPCRAVCGDRLVLAALNHPHAPCGECFLSLTPCLYFLSSPVPLPGLK